MKRNFSYCVLNVMSDLEQAVKNNKNLNVLVDKNKYVTKL